MAVTAPDSDTRWRCSRCGNLTRFDVLRSSRVREFVHLDLAGQPHVEEHEVIDETIESVTCRWCNVADTVVLVPRAEPTAQP